MSSSILVSPDAIVIDRGELSPVEKTRYADVLWIDGHGYGLLEARTARSEALRLLSLAEYALAHPPTPPVDEAQVETLAKVIRSFAATAQEYPIAHTDRTAMDCRAEALARRLLATGKVTVTT